MTTAAPAALVIGSVDAAVTALARLSGVRQDSRRKHLGSRRPPPGPAQRAPAPPGRRRIP
ncbi:hypothetical protein OHB41_11855 [Streptomyces sp. NBC_01571]|uniref:hypothetical protein n=1 Tax=Streptomyces sp. NBC_01571 TaxID=2975883 RepID=UPI00225A9E83|nr:hypothetical protein [Streptomyces sp. NBC_01571]MCX4573861.1 hypothetical protein [Streptomyces sp. NBC_01571]